MNPAIVLLVTWFCAHIVQITAITCAFADVHALRREKEMVPTLVSAIQAAVVISVAVLVSIELIRDEPQLFVSKAGKLVIETVLACILSSFVLLTYFRRAGSECRGPRIVRVMGIITTTIALLFVDSIPV